MPSRHILTVLDELADVIDATTPEQQELPTPCDGLDVRGLHQHLLGGVQYFTVALADPVGTERPNPRSCTGSDEPRVVAEAVRNLIATVRTAVADADETTKVNIVELAAGTASFDHVIGLLLAETLVHGWDLSRALDLPWQPEPAATELVRATLSAAIQPEYRGGEGMPFAPELPVSADASALERLLAFVGRPADWAPKS